MLRDGKKMSAGSKRGKAEGRLVVVMSFGLDGATLCAAGSAGSVVRSTNRSN